MLYIYPFDRVFNCMAKVALNEHFTIKKLFKITIGPILMMVFSSIYSIVDGIFVSNFCTIDEFAGLNLVFPVVMIVGGLGMMFGTGGAALIGKYLGQEKKDKANKVFTNVLVFSMIVGCIFSIAAGIFTEPLVKLLASTDPDSNDAMIKAATTYGRILLFTQPLFILQTLFQSLLLVNEKPMKSFLFTLIAGLTNIFLDILFVGTFKWGLIGAAAASVIGYAVGGFGGMFYFLFSKDNLFNLTHFKPDFRAMRKVITNGSSEFVNNVSSSIVSIVFNLQLLKFFGRDGVASYGILMYVGYVFIAIFLGYSFGIEPIVSYNYGAKNKAELHNILTKSTIFIGICSVVMCLFAILLSKPAAILFSNGSETLATLTTNAMLIYSLSFLLAGLSILYSCFFTALNNGLISALISFLRTLVFQIGFVFLFPLFMGEYGIFWAIVGAEFMSLFFAVFFILLKKKKYGY